MVQTVKHQLQKLTAKDWTWELYSILLGTPRETTSRSPAEVLMRRRLITLLDKLHPDSYPNRPVKNTPSIQRFEVATPALFRHYGLRKKCEEGQVEQVLGPRILVIVTPDGTLKKRHVKYGWITKDRTETNEKRS